MKTNQTKPIGRSMFNAFLTLLLVMLTMPAAVQAEDFTYTANAGTIIITGYTGPGGEVTIPSAINGLPVTSIGDGAFYNRANVTSVTIPNNVTSIGDYAFIYCTSLTGVTIGSNVTTIGDSAFGDCTSLTSITIPNSVTSIGDWAFNWCISLTSITIPDSVTSIGSRAFFQCASLTSITIPNSVTSIGDTAFSGCTSVTSVTIGNSVNSIGNHAFYFCTSLTAIMVDTNNPVYSSVDGVLFDKSQSTLIQYPGGVAGSYTIPDSVTNIGFAAFADCRSLTSVTIPNSVTSIGGEGLLGWGGGGRSLTAPA